MSFSVWNEQGKALKFSGTATYDTSGPGYDLAQEMLHKGKPNMNFKGVVTIQVTHIYDVAKGSNAGALIASGP